MLVELKAQEERHDGSPLPEAKGKNLCKANTVSLRFLTLIYPASPYCTIVLKSLNCFVLRVEIRSFPRERVSDQRKIAYLPIRSFVKMPLLTEGPPRKTLNSTRNALEEADDEVDSYVMETIKKRVKR